MLSCRPATPCLLTGCNRQRVDGDTVTIDLRLAGVGLPESDVVLVLENSDGGILECRITQSGGAVFVDLVETPVEFRFQPQLA